MRLTDALRALPMYADYVHVRIWQGKFWVLCPKPLFKTGLNLRWIGTVRKMDDAREYLLRLRQEMQSKWNRVLPSNELLSDRWEKAEFLGFGEGSSIYDSCVVLGNVSVGKDAWIGPFSLLDGSGGLTIGDGCDISAGVQIYTHDTVMQTLSEGKRGIDRASVEIGDYCHLGAGCIILKGVSIGHHSVVGAGCVVTKSFPAYSIIAGVPSKRIGSIEIADKGDEIKFVYDREKV